MFPIPVIVTGCESLSLIPYHRNGVRRTWARLGTGELAALSRGLENPGRVVLVDERLARSIAQDAGLVVWGTLRVLLEAKSNGLTERVEPPVDRLRESGMWISDSIRQEVLALAGEDDQ